MKKFRCIFFLLLICSVCTSSLFVASCDAYNSKFPKGVLTQNYYQNETVGIEFALPLSNWQFYSNELINDAINDSIEEGDISVIDKYIIDLLGEFEFLAGNSYTGDNVILFGEKLVGLDKKIEVDEYAEIIKEKFMKEKEYRFAGDKFVTIGDKEFYYFKSSLAQVIEDSFEVNFIQHIYLLKYENYIFGFVCTTIYEISDMQAKDFEIMFSLDLEYKKYEDYYEVIGLGGQRDFDFAIPQSYKGLPVTSIGASAFRDCIYLEKVTLPNTITRVGNYAFEDCIGLTSVTLSNQLEFIGGYAFHNCEKLSELVIPASVKNIATFAFSECDNLQSIVFEQNSLLEVIDKGAFQRCSNLTQITIPKSVTKIEKSVFYNCKKLSKIYYEGTIEQWKHIEILSDFDDYEIHCIDGVI